MSSFYFLLVKCLVQLLSMFSNNFRVFIQLKYLHRLVEDTYFFITASDFYIGQWPTLPSHCHWLFLRIRHLPPPVWQRHHQTCDLLKYCISFQEVYKREIKGKMFNKRMWDILSFRTPKELYDRLSSTESTWIRIWEYGAIAKWWCNTSVPRSADVYYAK